MREDSEPEAAQRAIRFITRSRGKGTAGIITIDLKGRVGASFNTQSHALGMVRPIERKGRWK